MASGSRNTSLSDLPIVDLTNSPPMASESPLPPSVPPKRPRESSPSDVVFSKREKRARTITPPSPEASTVTSPDTLLAGYTCPICFAPPRQATATPCGHVMCGECLFLAVGAGIARARPGAVTAASAAMQRAAMAEARCPVCRARIEGWDGVGGGVVGLELRTLFVL